MVGGMSRAVGTTRAMSPSELAGFWTRLADLDAEIAQCHAEGYAADVDRLLDERVLWQHERDELFRGLAGRPRRA